MKPAHLCLLGVIIILTLPACSRPTRMTGVMVYGHEVRTLRLCDQTQTHWLHASPEVQKELKEFSSQPPHQPYRELYLDFTGESTAESKGEFSKSYDGTMIVHKVHSLSLEIPAHCKETTPSSTSSAKSQSVWERAKLSGADFRATGNEPGWTLEIRHQSKIILVTNYGSDRYEFDLPEPEIDQNNRLTTFRVKQDEQDLTLTIQGEPCRDSMSGEEFTSQVTVTLGEEILRGCGRALH